MINNIKKFIILLGCIILFCGCGSLLKVCIERPSDIAKANLYTDKHPLTANELKHLMHDDTTHYKVVVTYSHCCSPCIEEMMMVNSKLWNADTAHVRWYFVLNDCSSLKYDNTAFLRNYGIQTPYMYYWRDDDPRFCTTADNRMLNIAQYIFDEQPTIESVVNGIPCTFVVSPHGQLYTSYHKYANGEVVLGNLDGLWNLVYQQLNPTLIPWDTPRPVQSLDISCHDTVDYSAFGDYKHNPRICTPEGCF